ncbi:hypothetical protein MT325_m682L [Paramecium bursaria chlorella virus MT325]|uniref:Uncharacterized protein m682L n=1 Tax=Paramecium bursaria Chlorella virus MT325 TaxID=346932 RepID=A7IV62_PBCVM|nr:hypothetical protein MT325_m682L [Paramecium bursaria chlorella virus MT325]
MLLETGMGHAVWHRMLCVLCFAERTISSDGMCIKTNILRYSLPDVKISYYVVHIESMPTRCQELQCQGV